MKRVYRGFFIAGIILLTVIGSCSDDPNDPDQNPGPGPGPGPVADNVTITSVTPGDVFWGDEITINGTGFSTVKQENVVKFTNVQPASCSINYTSAGGDIEIVSASATQLKIKIPYRLNIANEPTCGPQSANLEVTVKEKKGTFEGLAFHPLPWIGNFQYHYGWFGIHNVTRLGDSVLLSGGILGTSPRSSEYWDNIRLNVGGVNIPIKDRTIGISTGWAFVLPIEEFAEVNCSTDPDGWAARQVEFKIYLEGTNKSASRMLYVQYIPEQTVGCSDCPSTVNKLAPINETWKITGKNMNYNKVRFTPTDPNCSGNVSQHVALFNPTPFQATELEFTIPLSILTSGCSYGVSLIDVCDGAKPIGTVKIED